MTKTEFLDKWRDELMGLERSKENITREITNRIEEALDKANKGFAMLADLDTVKEWTR